MIKRMRGNFSLALISVDKTRSVEKISKMQNYFVSINDFGQA